MIWTGLNHAAGGGGVKGSDPDAMSFSLDRGSDAMKMICFISHI